MEIDCSVVGVPLEAVGERAERLAALGVDGCYTAEGPSDVFFPLVLAATSSTLATMTNAAVVFPRNPVHVAHSAWDLQRASGGRFRLGVAPQVRAHIERRFGATWERPTQQMEEFIGALRAIFATWQHGSPLAFEGEYYRHTSMPPMFTPAPLEVAPPPVLLGAQGPRMAGVAGRVADGLSVLPFHSARLLHGVTLPAARRGREEGPRAGERFEVVCGVIVGLLEPPSERAEVRRAVAALLGFYGSTPAYAGVLDGEGLGALHEALRAEVRAGRWATLADAIPDELIDAVAIVDTPTGAARRLRARFGGLADRVALFTPFAPSDEGLGELLDEVHGGAKL